MSWIVEFDAHTGAELVTYYLSDDGYTSTAASTPAHTHFQARVIDPGTLSRSLVAERDQLGKTELGFGEIELVNLDGGLDALVDYGLGGRRVVVRRGSGDYPGDFATVFSGTLDQAILEWQRVRLVVRDPLQLLDVPACSATYAGDNALPAGLEGTADDLKGQRKPLIYGVVLNVTPPQVNTSKLIYQVSSTAVTAIAAVYDRGSALTAGTAYTDQADLEANAPAAGYYRAWLAGGCFRLGSSPAGAVTADVTAGASSADRTAAQILNALATAAGVTSIPAADLTALDALNSAEIGLALRDETALTAMDQAAKSIGAWFGFDASGNLRLGRLDAPAGDPVATLDRVDVLSVARVAPGSSVRVPYRATVRYARNHTVQSTDLAGSVAADRRAWLAEDWRSTSAVDTDLQTKYLLADELTVDSALADSSAAATEAARLLALWGARRDTWRVELPYTATFAALALGDCVTLTLPRYGLDAGRLLRVTGSELALAAGTITLTLWG